MHPFYLGNYPQELIDVVAEKGKEEGLSQSRLPAFTAEELQIVKGEIQFEILLFFKSCEC